MKITLDLVDVHKIDNNIEALERVIQGHPPHICDSMLLGDVLNILKQIKMSAQPPTPFSFSPDEILNLQELDIDDFPISDSQLRLLRSPRFINCLPRRIQLELLHHGPNDSVTRDHIFELMCHRLGFSSTTEYYNSQIFMSFKDKTHEYLAGEEFEKLFKAD